MIKLILHFWSGTRTERVFTGLTEYTNHLIFQGLPKEDFKHFEVIEYETCLKHAWKYIPRSDRIHSHVNFECDDCRAGVLVDHGDIDELYRRKQDH